MVKLFLILILFSFSNANEISYNFNDETEYENTLEDTIVLHEDQIIQKVKSFIDQEVYDKNKKFIDIIFSPRENFYKNNQVDIVSIITTLKENGLLKLVFQKPQALSLHFKTSGSPLFFVKLMSDALRNIGYYRYVTDSSNFSNAEFIWSISLKSEYATDPLVLQKELQKSGCEIIDIERISSKEWSYDIEMADGFLNVTHLYDHQKTILKRSMYAHWLNVSNIEVITIATSRRNSWYPYIAYYDTSLNLLKVLKRDRRSKRITVHVPKGAKYIKISDIYTLKNVTEDLILYPRSKRY